MPARGSILRTLALGLGLSAMLPAFAESQIRIDPPDFSVPSGEPQVIPAYPRLALQTSGEMAADNPESSAWAYPWRNVPPEQPDWKGVARDTGYFLGYQFVILGLLYVLPESVTQWTDEDKEEYSFEKWRYNVSHPRWDNDKFYINYILHPYWGGTYYIRGRERGLDGWQAFGYSAFMSALYEFGAEAIFERASYTDLIVTPVLGSLLGEYVFLPLQRRIRNKPGALDWTDKLLLTMVDPIGVASAETDRLFGMKPTYQLQPLAMLPPVASPETLGTTGNLMRTAYSNDVSPAWGMRFRMTW